MFNFLIYIIIIRSLSFYILNNKKLKINNPICINKTAFDKSIRIWSKSF